MTRLETKSRQLESAVAESSKVTLQAQRDAKSAKESMRDMRKRSKTLEEKLQATGKDSLRPTEVDIETPTFIS